MKCRAVNVQRLVLTVKSDVPGPFAVNLGDISSVSPLSSTPFIPHPYLSGGLQSPSLEGLDALGPLALAAICGTCVRFEPPSGRRDAHLAAPACSPGIMQWRAAASRSAGPPQSSHPPKARDVTHLPVVAM